MMIQIDEIPVAKRKERSAETSQVINDVFEMVTKRIRVAEIVPLCPDRYQKQTGGFTDKLKRACRINSFGADHKKIADFYVQMRRDAEGTPHWYLKAIYIEELAR